jgi:hypothetical protein
MNKLVKTSIREWKASLVFLLKKNQVLTKEEFYTLCPTYQTLNSADAARTDKIASYIIFRLHRRNEEMKFENMIARRENEFIKEVILKGGF